MFIDLSNDVMNAARPQAGRRFIEQRKPGAAARLVKRRLIDGWDTHSRGAIGGRLASRTDIQDVRLSRTRGYSQLDEPGIFAIIRFPDESGELAAYQHTDNCAAKGMKVLNQRRNRVQRDTTFARSAKQSQIAQIKGPNHCHQVYQPPVCPTRRDEYAIRGLI
ncbi:MAG TPA: hypothetical protein PK205_12095 [Promineifilum sp.]|nr:hypothetical protein [Promineifilum sp.]